MSTHTWSRAIGRIGVIIGLLALAVLVVGVGLALPDRPLAVLGLAVIVLAFGITLADPAIIPLLATPLILVVARVGGGGIDLSVSDVALAGALAPAIFLGQRPYSPALRSLLWLNAIYQATTLFTVIAHPYTANTIEWFHAWVLVSGALIVGWAVGRQGHGRTAVLLLFAAAVTLAVLTLGQAMVQFAAGDFSPVYVQWPYGMHKNLVGTVLAMVAVIAYLHPVWLRLPGRGSLVLFWFLVAAVLATQSRQALIGLGIALLVVLPRSDPDHRRSKTILLGVTPALALIGLTVKEQIESGNEFNSFFARLDFYSDAIRVWSHDPLFGAGLRWWYTDRFDVTFQPPNAELEVLTSAGFIGLLGFLAMMVGTLVVLWRLDPRYGTVAFAVLLCRFVQTQFDLYWVAAQASLPFLVVGICLGALAHEMGRDVPAGWASVDTLSHDGAPKGSV